MKTLLILLALSSAAANAQTYAGDDIYLKASQVPVSKQVSKLEAMRTLIVSQGKDAVYRCRIQEMSNKGTIKNK